VGEMVDKCCSMISRSIESKAADKCNRTIQTTKKSTEIIVEANTTAVNLRPDAYFILNGRLRLK